MLFLYYRPQVKLKQQEKIQSLYANKCPLQWKSKSKGTYKIDITEMNS